MPATAKPEEGDMWGSTTVSAVIEDNRGGRGCDKSSYLR